MLKKLRNIAYVLVMSVSIALILSFTLAPVGLALWEIVLISTAGGGFTYHILETYSIL